MFAPVTTRGKRKRYPASPYPRALNAARPVLCPEKTTDQEKPKELSLWDKFGDHLFQFLVAGVNWGFALFIANQCYVCIRQMFLIGSGGTVATFAQSVSHAFIVIILAAFFVTLLNHFVHQDFCARSIIPVLDGSG